jgi:hypothetical protein
MVYQRVDVKGIALFAEMVYLLADWTDASLAALLGNAKVDLKGIYTAFLKAVV